MKAGDTIRSSTVARDIMERGGKEGRVVFLITETSYTDQNGKLVAKARSTTIHQ